MKRKALLAASMAATLALSSVHAQVTPSAAASDPYLKNVDRERLEALKQQFEANNLEATRNALALAERDAAAPLNLSICYEDFSLPLAMAAALQREKLTDAELYAKVLASVGKAEVRQETFSVIRTRSGQQVQSESITETIYPTEYQPAQSSAVVSGDTNSDAQKANVQPAPGPVATARIPATPSAFETRNVGFTMEVAPVLSEDGTIVDIRLNPQHVTLQGRSKWGQELSTTESPIFETQRLNLEISATMNAPHLIGTMNRPPDSKQDQDSANRVWFAFVTVTPAK